MIPFIREFHETLLSLILALLVIFGVLHLYLYIFAKVIIWIFYELFNINWYNNFWAVYFCNFIIHIITNKIKFKIKG